jgi:hypothetical protein
MSASRCWLRFQIDRRRRLGRSRSFPSYRLSMRLAGRFVPNLVWLKIHPLSGRFCLHPCRGCLTLESRMRQLCRNHGLARLGSEEFLLSCKRKFKNEIAGCLLDPLDYADDRNAVPGPRWNVYSPSKKSRDAIIKNLMKQFESSPDRGIAESKERSKKATGKKRRVLEKESKLVEIGDWRRRGDEGLEVGPRP